MCYPCKRRSALPALGGPTASSFGQISPQIDETDSKDGPNKGRINGTRLRGVRPIWRVWRSYQIGEALCGWQVCGQSANSLRLRECPFLQDFLWGNVRSFYKFASKRALVW